MISGRLADTPYMTDAHRELARSVDGICAKEIDPRGSADTDAEARAFVAVLAREGLLRLCVPSSTQASLDVRSLAVVREALAHGSGLADLVFVMQALGGGPITVAGSDEQKARWLPAVGEGTAIAAFALTEPEAGSDVAAISTRAVRDGEGWVLRGHKKFISQAPLADFFCVFARTADTGGKGLTAFVVDGRAPGLQVRPQQPMAAHPLGEVLLDDVRVSDAARVGAEGEGMKIALRTLDLCRPTVAAAACGMARRALEEATVRASTRVQFGKPLAEQQLIQEKLARMSTELSAATLLTAHACAEADAGKPATLAVSQAKLYATEAAGRIVDDAVQIFGGDGVMRGSAVERLYREVRALRIYEGTSEVQHLIIARELLKTLGGRAD